MTEIKNSKGFTLLELLVSIFVSSVVITMLIQMLTMSLQARQDLAFDNALKDESYLIVEQVKWNVFDMQAQSVSISETPSDITVTFNHDYDITIDPVTHVISQDTSAAFSETLVYNKSTETISYNSIRMHTTNVFFVTGTTFDVTPVDSTCVPTSTSCSDVVLTITLYITIEVSGGRIETQSFETTIII